MGVEKHEPIFAQFCASPEYAACRSQFKEKGWIGFLKKFQGYNDQAAMAFTQSFDGKLTEVGNLKIKVTKKLISKETRLPLTKERYFKGGPLE